jgi:probable addiction module antidote protein
MDLKKLNLKKFDVIDFLDSDEAMVEYLNAALAENDPKYFAKALGNVARAKGMTSVSEATGLGRQALYRALSDEGNPRIDTLFRVLESLNIRLAIAQ